MMRDSKGRFVKAKKIKIEFLSGEKTPLEYECATLKDAVEQAARDGADLREANLTGAKLTGAKLTGAKLTGANLTGANLTGANLTGANLYGANLYGANLYGANLYGANLERAKLYGANLYGANLYGANLTGANLERAKLYGANLTGANLYGAKVYGRKLWDGRPYLRLGPCGSVDRTTLVLFFDDGSEPLIKCGCFSGNLEEFTAQIQKTHSGTFREVEYMAMVKYIETIRQYQLDSKKKDGGNE